jgi:hypothetical protein
MIKQSASQFKSDHRRPFCKMDFWQPGGVRTNDSHVLVKVGSLTKRAIAAVVWTRIAPVALVDGLFI